VHTPYPYTTLSTYKGEKKKISTEYKSDMESGQKNSKKGEKEGKRRK
jgi:hypothetical protein